MRRVVWGAVGTLVVLATLAAAGVFLTNTATGFRWLTEAVTVLSRDRVKFDGIEGHLGVPLAIRKLTLTSDTQRIEVEGLRLTWQPRAVWQRRIEIDLLAAQFVRVNILKQDTLPPELPVSLRLPLDLQVRVQALELAQLDIAEAGTMLTFRHIKTRLEGIGDRYRIMQTALETPWADLRGELAIGKDAPFALQGRANAERLKPVPVMARLELTGKLAAPVFELNAKAVGMHFFASGEAAPFSPVRLPRLLVAGEGIDPRLFVADAPSADLAFSGIFQGQPGERLFGTFSLGNRLPGRIDQQRLPLVNLVGAVLGDAEHADFSTLAIDLGAAGKLTGDGQWRDGRLSVNLASPSLNLAGLHRDLNATRIKATLQLAGDAVRQTLSAEVTETWGQGRFMISHADAALRLESANFEGQAGRLTASGSLQLDASRAFSAAFDASQINPARFGKFPRARLNARGEVSGALAPALRLQTRFTLPPGELEGRPVKGQGQLRYENRHLAAADIDLNLAGNRARLKGAYGRAGDRLNWDIDAPALERLKLGLGGRLTSRGSVSGDPAQPQIEAEVAASGLRFHGGYAADALTLQLKLEAAAEGLFNGQFDARGMTVAGQRLTGVRATAQGHRNAHRLTFDARLPDWRLTASMVGGLDAAQTWRGRLNHAEAQGRWPMALSAPATLLLSRDQQQVNNLALTLAGGKVMVEQFDRQGTQIASRGTLVSLPLAPLLLMLETAPPFTTDLRVGGDWNLRAGGTLDGRLRLIRQSGDVRLTEPALDFGLTTLALDFNAKASRVIAKVEADSREAGQLSAEAQATLQREDTAFTLPRSEPLAWTAQFAVPNLRLLKSYIPVGIRADARVSARFSGSGSLAAPRIDGQITADAIRFAMPEEGVSITGGMLKLALAGDRVRVQEGVLHGQSGRIVVRGEAQLKNPQAGLTLDFQRFSVTNRSDRRVTLSGTGRLVVSPQQLRLEGELRADRARLEMPEAGRPALSSDVVIIGQPARAKSTAQRIPLQLDLKLGLGDDFLFKGAGLDVRLGGLLRVFTLNEALRGEGRIQVVEGRYAAYGQTLTIERGILGFIGSIDNPGLDVLAVRKTPTVKAGVQIRGTMQRPLVTLYSDPVLPDSEKLAWLVLGHGLDNGGGQQEFALMQLAAGALLGQAESVSVQAQLADALGIENFAVRAGEGEDLSGTMVSVGKRISSRATLSYEQSLNGLNQVVKVLYQLSPRVRLEAQAGQQSSFDVFYTREYD